MDEAAEQGVEADDARSSYKRAEVTGYVFNPVASRPTVVIGIGLAF